MTLFLIGILALGILSAHLFKGKLPDVFLALISPLLGLILFALDMLALLILHIKVNIIIISTLVVVEIIALLIYQLFRGLFSHTKKRMYWLFLVVSFAYTGLTNFFYKFNYSFVSNDSLFMIVFARNILESGLSKFYIASPSGVGILIPIFQTLGMLFGDDYTWFIQPVISIIFFSLFIYFCYRTLRKYDVVNWLATCVPLILVGMLISSNIVLTFTAYIHTNFDTGLFFFLSVISIIYFLEEKNENWLVFTTAFLIIFGLTRVENVLFALPFILIFLATGKIPYRLRLPTFLPYLGFQFLWYLYILTLRTNSLSDQISPQMMIVVLAGILAVSLLVIFSDKRGIDLFLTRYLSKLFPLLICLSVLAMFLLNPETTSANILTLVENMFLVGHWGALWGFVLVFFVVVGIFGPRVSQERNYLYLIVTFFVMILIVGNFRLPYRLSWVDSGNRMFVHILPIAFIYLIDKLGIWFKQSNPSKGKITSDKHLEID